MRGCMSIALRPARSGDFEFCARLYFSGMEETIRQLKLDMVTQNRNLRERWNVEEVRIITSDGTNVGWMQSSIRTAHDSDGYIDTPFQNRGIDDIMVDRRGQTGRRPVTLGVVKTNPALGCTSDWDFASPGKMIASSTCGARRSWRRRRGRC